ncbi:heavy-metal-associated domain-containing protein [Carnobacteriaceae bacterium zg-C25]|nr:heavy-metal-associated domain-containing protein [Carnobacteriaceae bacterium zg-C25]
MRQIVQITGMSCAHCAARVQKALETLTKSPVEMDLQQQTATIHTNELFDLTQIKNCLNDIGYDVKS